MVAQLTLQLAEGFFGGGDKVTEFAGVFFSGGRFDSAGDIHGVGAGGEDRVGDVIGSKAAGEDKGEAEELVALIADHVPIHANAGAAVRAGSMRVEEDGVGQAAAGLA